MSLFFFLVKPYKIFISREVEDSFVCHVMQPTTAILIIKLYMHWQNYQLNYAQCS